ncbi:PqqD family protein [Paenibacillus chartarius]|uniref:PqqD family protein n=1 Tax=Paenibacillus chartarius TaxID=747481 RepID=A0ABV6DUW1_9BACL
MNRYIQKERYETVHMDGEWIVLNTSDYTVTKLNEVGGFCWSLLAEPQSIQSLQEALHERYDGVADDAAIDLDAFIADLLACGLLRHVSDE